jgi:hypothetical protein
MWPPTPKDVELVTLTLRADATTARAGQDLGAPVSLVAEAGLVMATMPAAKVMPVIVVRDHGILPRLDH